MKRQLNVILGNFDNNINNLLSAIIEKAIEKERHLNVASIFYMEDIEEYARRNPIDLFVIVVNNVHL